VQDDNPGSMNFCPKCLRLFWACLLIGNVPYWIFGLLLALIANWWFNCR
jgi:hypothetical protein